MDRFRAAVTSNKQSLEPRVDSGQRLEQEIETRHVFCGNKTIIIRLDLRMRSRWGAGKEKTEERNNNNRDPIREGCLGSHALGPRYLVSHQEHKVDLTSGLTEDQLLGQGHSIRT